MEEIMKEAAEEIKEETAAAGEAKEVLSSGPIPQ